MDKKLKKLIEERNLTDEDLLKLLDKDSDEESEEEEEEEEEEEDEEEEEEDAEEEPAPVKKTSKKKEVYSKTDVAKIVKAEIKKALKIANKNKGSKSTSAKSTGKVNEFGFKI